MKKTMTLRLTPEAHAALERMASREARSMNSWIEYVIRQEAQKRGAWSPSATNLQPVRSQTVD